MLKAMVNWLLLSKVKVSVRITESTGVQVRPEVRFPTTFMCR